MLITCIELEKILNDPNLILIDTRSYKEYSEGHIPGAVNLDLLHFTGLIPQFQELRPSILRPNKFSHLLEFQMTKR